MAPLLAGILIIGIPAVVVGGIALLGKGGAASGGDSLPSNVHIARSIKDVMGLLSKFAQIEANGGVLVGFLASTPDFLDALRTVGREHPQTLFIAVSEPASDAMGALEGLTPEDVGIDLRCPEGAAGLAGTAGPRGVERFVSCWAPGSSRDDIYHVLAGAAAVA